eukprot:m.364645 g.364645  ORF g.364645 m.364645 type:complete len:312 (-) comp27878_c0_seq1:275-1210(-)
MSEKEVLVVFTANSNTGFALVNHLVENYASQYRIRCVVRKKTTAKIFQGMPIEVVNADITQAPLLKAVFADDVNTCFWATPTSENRAELTKLFIDACIAYGVDFPVVVSCVDADKKLTMYQQQFAEIEEYCAAKFGTPVKRQLLDTGKQVLQPTILRCGMFYQNLFGSLASIASGTFYYPLGKNKGFLPHVDIADVAKVAAAIMTRPQDLGGKTYNIIGEYHQGNQIASAITMATGHPCKYEAVDDETAVMAFEALGLPEWLAMGNVETLAYYREDNGQDIESDIPAITGAAPTKLSAFAKKHVKPILDQM